MRYHFNSLVLVRKGHAFYVTLYQEVFFSNPGGGGSLNYSINNRGVKIDDVIQNNYINTFGVALMENFNLISVVITTNRKTEIIVFIRRRIPK